MAVSNTLTNVYDKILAGGLLALRKAVLLPRLVNTNYSNNAAQKGDVINIPRSKAQAVAQVSTSNVLKDPAGKNPDNVQIALDQWYQTDFGLTDKELAEIDRNRHFMPMQVSEAAKALAEHINSDIIGRVDGLTKDGVSGCLEHVASGRPFSTTGNIQTSISGLIEFFGENQVPREDRFIILDPLNEGDAVTNDWFRAADAAGTDEAIRNASLGRRFGFDWFMDQQARQSHIAGTDDGAYTVAAGSNKAIGDTAITLETGTGTMLKGDSLQFNDEGPHYLVESLTGFDLVLGGRGLLSAISTGDTAIIKNNSETMNYILAMHRDCIAFASRPLVTANTGGNIIRSMTDPVSGLSLRLEVTRQYKQTAWEFDVLWGAKVVNPEFGCRLTYDD